MEGPRTAKYPGSTRKQFVERGRDLGCTYLSSRRTWAQGIPGILGYPDSQTQDARNSKDVRLPGPLGAVRWLYEFYKDRPDPSLGGSASEQVVGFMNFIKIVTASPGSVVAQPVRKALRLE